MHRLSANSARSLLIAFALISLVTIVPGSFTGCSRTVSNAPKVDQKSAADGVLTALRTGDYSSALAALKTGAAGKRFTDIPQLKAWVEENRLQPQSWTWGEVTYPTTAGSDASPSEVTGAVIFTDGSSGRVRARMEAFGTGANPWRINEFDLTR